MIFLTAKDQQKDKLRGLHLGADDYISKPFSVLEIVSRIKANLRKICNKCNIKVSLFF